VQLEKTIGRLAEVAMHMGTMAMSENFKAAFVHASPFLTAIGVVIMGWMLFWRATVAAPKLMKLTAGLDDKARIEKINKNKNAAYNEGQMKSVVYFIHTIMPSHPVIKQWLKYLKFFWCIVTFSNILKQ